MFYDPDIFQKMRIKSHFDTLMAIRTVNGIRNTIGICVYVELRYRKKFVRIRLISYIMSQIPDEYIYL